MNRKKALSLLLAAAMTFTMSAISFAAETVAPVATVEESTEDTQSADSQSTDTKEIEVSVNNVAYTVEVSYNSAVSFTGKKLNVKDLATDVTIYKTVSGTSTKVCDAKVTGKFTKSDVVNGKKTGSANFVVKNVKAAKGTSKDNRKVAKAVAKAVKALTDSKKTLSVDVMTLSLSNNGVVSANNMKKKEAKSKLTSSTASTNYIISVKFNTKKLAKSKVTVYYTQTNAKGNKVVKAAKLKNGKNGVTIKTASTNGIQISGSVEATIYNK
ncbi:MAG: hypothetical protein K6F39_06520 [Lachnospiraceae bacterium]|nr:hypothetical protein [Lachnospiraceae bacterium]